MSNDQNQHIYMLVAVLLRRLGGQTVLTDDERDYLATDDPVTIEIVTPVKEKPTHGAYAEYEHTGQTIVRLDEPASPPRPADFIPATTQERLQYLMESH